MIPHPLQRHLSKCESNERGEERGVGIEKPVNGITAM